MFVARRLMLALLAAAVAGLALVACGEDKDKTASGDTAADSGPCKQVDQPEAKQASLKKPATRLDPKKTYTIEFKTSCGDFTIELDVKNNPKTAASVKHIADEGVYDNTTFHRVVPDFVIQGGDPEGTGGGGAGYTVVEKPSRDTTYDVGVVAMAKAGNEPPGASSSQFFVVSGSQGASLPPEYAVAGKVIEGDDTVANISALGAGDGPPSQTVVIHSAKSAVG